MVRYKVGRHEENITINNLEWLLTNEGEVMTFFTINEAKAFLLENGIKDFEGIKFIEEEEVKQDG